MIAITSTSATSNTWGLQGILSTEVLHLCQIDSIIYNTQNSPGPRAAFWTGDDCSGKFVRTTKHKNI